MDIHKLNIYAYRLKIARKKNKLSQERLGILAGIDEQSASARMNQYERGKHLPDFLMASKIAGTLNLPTAYFYAEDDILAELIEEFSTLDKEYQKSVIDYIRALK